MRAEEQLKTQKLEAELRFLKAQVNPHFLFNTLNNIYSLSVTKSDSAPDMILKLSDMMSFMLYDCQGESVDLSQEIDYLQNYLALQQLKKSGQLNVSLEIQGDPNGIRLTPMLFIPFFENAFKHGNIDDVQNGYLTSSFQIENDKIEFKITNSLSSKVREYEQGGVGLANVRKRMELLYPNAHELTMKNTGSEFIVDFTIYLKLNGAV